MRLTTVNNSQLNFVIVSCAAILNDDNDLVLVKRFIRTGESVVLEGIWLKLVCALSTASECFCGHFAWLKLPRIRRARRPPPVEPFNSNLQAPQLHRRAVLYFELVWFM